MLMKTQRRRKPLRLPGYDYGTQGAYFVTICTAKRRCILDDDRTRRALTTAWRSTVTNGREPQPWEFIVMPNHVHGIVWIPGNRNVDAKSERSRAQRSLATSDRSLPAPSPSTRLTAQSEGVAPLRGPASGSLGSRMARFKSLATKRTCELIEASGSIWQRGYYERVIRDERELEAARRYVLDNPRRWDQDPNNPALIR